MDILIVNLHEPPSLLRDDVAAANRWPKVKLIGTRSDRSAIGSVATRQLITVKEGLGVVSNLGWSNAGRK